MRARVGYHHHHHQQQRSDDLIPVTIRPPPYPVVTAASTSPVPSRRAEDGSDEDGSRVTAAEMLQHESAQLRADMEQQRVWAERDLSQLRGQLAEANSDNRTLRMQLARLQHLNQSTSQQSPSLAIAVVGGDSTTANHGCSNCKRVERLCDILQQKLNRHRGECAMNVADDAALRSELGMCERSVLSNETHQPPQPSQEFSSSADSLVTEHAVMENHGLRRTFQDQCVQTDFAHGIPRLVFD